MKHRIIKAIKAYQPLFHYFLLFTGMETLFRLANLLYEHLFFSEFTFKTFAYGLRMDLVTFSYIMGIGLFIYLLGNRRVIQIFFTLFFALNLYLELITLPYLAHYLNRPDILFIDSMVEFGTVTAMAWKLYPFYFILIILFLILGSYGFYKLFARMPFYRFKSKLWLFPLMIPLIFLGARSSLDASTPSPSFHTFCRSNIHNQIASNTFFSLAYALSQKGKDHLYHYGDMNTTEAIKIVQDSMGYHFENNHTLRRLQIPHVKTKQNVILVILESFGSRYVGHLGGTPTTPQLDRLTKRALYCTNMYATGTRTDKGISSVTSGLVQNPTSYLKMPNSQNNFYTLARSFAKNGYHTMFLYGGDSSFDNMSGYMLANGYQSIIDKFDFDSKAVRSTWGYVDESVYDKAIELASKEDKPFFITIMTLSSHEPFDYPRGKVAPYKKQRMNYFANAIKYADYAIGKFIRGLHQKGLDKNTLIVFTADHNDDAFGTTEVPIRRYRIPTLFITNKIKPRAYDAFASQIDIAPTILDLSGIIDTIPTTGASLLSKKRNSAFLVYNNNYAYLTPKGYTYFVPDKKPRSYTYSGKAVDLKKEEKEGLAYILTAYRLYKEGYR